MAVKVNFKTTETLAKELNALVKKGYYKDRSEAINEALRRLISIIKAIEKIDIVAKHGKGKRSVTKSLLEARAEEDW